MRQTVGLALLSTPKADRRLQRRISQARKPVIRLGPNVLVIEGLRVVVFVLSRLLRRLSFDWPHRCKLCLIDLPCRTAERT